MTLENPDASFDAQEEAPGFWKFLEDQGLGTVTARDTRPAFVERGGDGAHIPVLQASLYLGKKKIGDLKVARVPSAAGRFKRFEGELPLIVNVEGGKRRIGLPNAPVKMDGGVEWIQVYISHSPDDTQSWPGRPPGRQDAYDVPFP